MNEYKKKLFSVALDLAIQNNKYKVDTIVPSYVCPSSIAKEFLEIIVNHFDNEGQVVEIINKCTQDIPFHERGKEDFYLITLAAKVLKEYLYIKVAEHHPIINNYKNKPFFTVKLDFIEGPHDLEYVSIIMNNFVDIFFNDNLKEAWVKSLKTSNFLITSELINQFHKENFIYNAMIDEIKKMFKDTIFDNFSKEQLFKYPDFIQFKKQAMSYKYQFLSKIEGKKILYIPIISMRSYEDNLYDLTCDGNVNRFISNFLDIPKDVKYECSILLPSSLSTTPKSQDLIERFVKETDNKVFIINMIAYPKGGASQLRDMNGALDIFKYIQTEFESYDTIIYESNMLGALIEGVKPRYDFKTIYWCPVSKTTEINPEFLRKYEKVDLELVTKSDTTWVASANQLEYFQNYLNKNCKQKVYNINLVTNLINPRLKIFEFKTNAWILSQTDHLISEGYKLIFLPFRLTDSGYHLNTIVNDIKTVSRAFEIKICVLYSDPNDSGVLEEESKKAGDLIFKKIPKSREVYYTILRDVDCIIPYLDDMDNILHASVFEFMHFNSKVIYLKTSSISLTRNMR